MIPTFIRLSAGGGDLPEPIRKLRDCSLLVLGSGYATSLYAHEILLEAVGRLQDEGLDIALVVPVYSKYGEPCFGKLKERIKCMSKMLLV